MTASCWIEAPAATPLAAGLFSKHPPSDSGETAVQATRRHWVMINILTGMTLAATTGLAIGQLKGNGSVFAAASSLTNHPRPAVYSGLQLHQPAGSDPLQSVRYLPPLQDPSLDPTREAGDLDAPKDADDWLRPLKWQPTPDWVEHPMGN